MNRRSLPRQQAVIGVAVAAAVSVALPGFLVGALSVQVRATFGVAEGRYGWAMSSYFLVATLGSVVLGRLAQVVGPRRQLIVALLGVAVIDLLIAVTSQTFGTLVLLLAAAGACNAGAQTAVNLALTRAQLPRLGLAIAVKQSGMPAASMLGGLAVPVIALTLGWRWAFVAAASIAIGAAIAVGAVVAPHAATGRVGVRPSSSTGALVRAGVASALLSFGAGALNAWLVESGVDSGLRPGVAGLMLSIGAASGVSARILWGLRLDRLDAHPFRVAGWVALLGSVSTLSLAIRVPSTHVIATVIAFAAGWSWPIFTNFGIVRVNEHGAAAATGVTQTGVYLGVFAAPLTSGALIEAFGYPVMWAVTATALAAGAAMLLVTAQRF